MLIDAFSLFITNLQNKKGLPCIPPDRPCEATSCRGMAAQDIAPDDLSCLVPLVM